MGMRFTGGYNEHLMDIDRALQCAGRLDEDFDYGPSEEDLEDIIKPEKSGGSNE